MRKFSFVPYFSILAFAAVGVVDTSTQLRTKEEAISPAKKAIHSHVNAL